MRTADTSADSHDVSLSPAGGRRCVRGRGGGHRLAGRPAPDAATAPVRPQWGHGPRDWVVPPRGPLRSGCSGCWSRADRGIRLAGTTGGQSNAYKRGDRQVGAVCGADGGQVVDLVRRAVASSLTSSAPTRSRPAAARRAGHGTGDGRCSRPAGRVAIPLYEERSESSTIPPAGVVLVSLQLDDAVATTHVRPEVRGRERESAPRRLVPTSRSAMRLSRLTAIAAAISIAILTPGLARPPRSPQVDPLRSPLGATTVSSPRTERARRRRQSGEPLDPGRGGQRQHRHGGV